MAPRESEWRNALWLIRPAGLQPRYLLTVIPAQAGIQYAAAFQFYHNRSGILDHPPSRVMTAMNVEARCGGRDAQGAMSGANGGLRFP
jgi:hypothetical protein